MISALAPYPTLSGIFVAKNKSPRHKSGAVPTTPLIIQREFDVDFSFNLHGNAITGGGFVPPMLNSLQSCGIKFCSGGTNHSQIVRESVCSNCGVNGNCA